MVTVIGFCAELLVILDVNGFVAVERDQRRRADIYRIRPERHGLGRVHAVADSPGDDELHLAVHPDIFERGAGLTNSSEGGDAGVLLRNLGGGARAAFHAVDHHHIGARFGCQAHVVEHSGRTHLHKDRHLPVGRFAQFFDLDDHIVRTEKIGMPRRAALVHPHGQIPLFGNCVQHL